MIFESLEQIKSRIDQPKNKCMDMAVRSHKELNMLVNGVGVQDYLEKIEGYENDRQKKLRHKVAKSTKHIFGAALRPLDKVFTARGGSEHFDLPESQQAQMANILASIKNGKSLKDWHRATWKNKFVTDPNGLIFYEISEDWIYPTYKSIMSIHDYIVTGDVPEYVIFKAHKQDDDGDYYRVIDDALDRVVRVKGESIIEVLDETYPNYMGYVPAYTCSDIDDPNFDVKISPIDSVVEVAMEYLRDMSIHSIYKYLHGYPVFWRYVEDCPHCKGYGELDGKTCTYCSGTGKRLTKDVSDVIGIEVPANGDPDITPPAGYEQPDLATWAEQRTELDWLNAAIVFGIWGSHTQEQADNETATGRFIDTQPVNDRLMEIRDTANNLMTFGVDAVGRFHFPAYNGCSVALGDRFQIEGPDAIMKRYTDGKANGMPDAALNHLLTQFYYAEFAAQPIQLKRHLKSVLVEPFPHMTAKEVNEAGINGDDYLAKIYFPEWWAGKTDDEILFTDANELRADLQTYIKTKKDERIQGAGV